MIRHHKRRDLIDRWMRRLDLKDATANRLFGSKRVKTKDLNLDADDNDRNDGYDALQQLYMLFVRSVIRRRYVDK